MDYKKQLIEKLSESVVPFGETEELIAQMSENIKADHENPSLYDDKKAEQYDNASPVDVPMDLEESDEAGDDEVSNVVKSMNEKRINRILKERDRL